MKYIHVYTLFLVFVFHTSCGQNQTNAPKENINPIDYQVRNQRLNHYYRLWISSKIEMGTFGLQQVMVFIDTMENRLPISQVN